MWKTYPRYGTRTFNLVSNWLYILCCMSHIDMQDESRFSLLLFLDTGMQCHASHNFAYHPGNHLEKSTCIQLGLFCCTVNTSSLPQLLACRQCDQPMQCKGLYGFLKGNTPPITTAASNWVGFFCESMAHVHSVLTDAYWLCLPCTCAGRSPDRSKSAAHTTSPRKNFCLTLCLSLLTRLFPARDAQISRWLEWKTCAQRTQMLYMY